MRYKVINQTFQNSGNGNKSWKPAFITGENRDQGSIFRYETRRGCYRPLPQFKRKVWFMTPLVYDHFNLCYNQAKSIGIN